MSVDATRADASARARVRIGGVFVDAVDLTAAAERVDGFLASRAPHQVVTVNLDFLAIARRSERFREVLNAADLAVADGMPLVWLSRLGTRPLPERIAGVDLVDRSCTLAERRGVSAFLLGGSPDVIRRAARRLELRHPGLQIAGLYSPRFGPPSEEEDQEIVAMIRRAKPSLLLVALGAPRQDLWIREHLAELEVPVAIGVGCVFDLLAGIVSRAPGWMQRRGLEWAHRLRLEPRRLWRRYLIDDVPTLARLLAERFAARGGEAA